MPVINIFQAEEGGIDMRSVEKGPLAVFKGQLSNEKRSPHALFCGENFINLRIPFLNNEHIDMRSMNF